ncbi:Saccharopine dehydrogenase-domain-containing protein [Xylariaceae sp. AK1471]|nr:Saccharopine dehydrogenase-domain-containing protein [Xylariaceae sp. AK1471]
MTTVTREPRKYDIVLLGATGYTGGLTAEHIARHLPTNLRWALAGRSSAKLEALANKLRILNPDRLQPDIEVVSIDDRETLHNLIGNAKVCISVVSYWSVGALVIEACVENKTDYVDTEGDIATQRQWCDKFHDRAAANGTIVRPFYQPRGIAVLCIWLNENTNFQLVHSCGMCTAPHDLLSWAAVRELADTYSVETKEIILAIEELPQEVSGGTMKALGNIFEADPRIARQAQKDPWYLSPKRGTETSTFTSVLGIRRDPYFGVLSASTFAAAQNRAIAHRTWGLLHGKVQGYSSNFQYNEYDKVSSVAAGFLRVLGQYITSTALSTGFFYRVVRKLFPAAGDGPDVEKSRRSTVRMEVQAVAEARPGETPRRVRASFLYPGGPYLVTALFLAEAAASLLYNRTVEGKISGGCLTPTVLGNDLLERVRKAGAQIEISSI